MKEFWDLSLHVIRDMGFDTTFLLAELRPPEHRKTQIYSGGVKGVDVATELEDVGRPLPLSLSNHMIREVLKDAIIPILIGSGKSRFRHLFANSEVVALRSMRIQSNNQIPQTYAIGKLAEHHRQQLIPTCETLHIAVSSVLAYEIVEMVTIKKRY